MAKKERKEEENIEALYKKYPKEYVTLKIKDVKIWEDNPNDDYSSVKDLAKILKKHGQISDIVVWRKNMTCYKGNHTLMAMMENKQTKISVILVDFPSRAQAELYGMADNLAGRLSVLNEEAMVKLLKAERIKSFADSKELPIFAGLSEKRFKAMLLSTENLPGKLPDVELKGTVECDAFSVVIQFKSEKQLNKFKERIDCTNENRRVFPYEMIKPYLVKE